MTYDAAAFKAELAAAIPGAQTDVDLNADHGAKIGVGAMVKGIWALAVRAPHGAAPSEIIAALVDMVAEKHPEALTAA